MNFKELNQKNHEYFESYKKSYLEKYNQQHIQCGTAGIRCDASYLPYPCFRTAVFMAIKSRQDISRALGLMITASHNPINDNGLKCTNWNGEMLETEYEDILNRFICQQEFETAVHACIKDIEELCAKYNQKKEHHGGQQVLAAKLDMSHVGHLFVGCDTRPSSKNLIHIAETTFKLCGCEVINFEELTTPQLHFNVQHFNSAYFNNKQALLSFKSAPKDFAHVYYEYFIGYFKKLCSKKTSPTSVILDCSNGVGGIRVGPLEQQLSEYFHLMPINNKQPSALNVDCGAEFVQKEKIFPTQSVQKYEELVKQGCKPHVACFDGDADRIVFFYIADQKMHLLDGDKEMAYITMFIKLKVSSIIDHLHSLEKKGFKIGHQFDFDHWKIGVGLTAYTNGKCVDYLRNKLKVIVQCGPSGVKNLHHICLDYDIGVYFEANGHGTLIVNNGKLEMLEKALQVFRDAESNKKEHPEQVHNELNQLVKTAEQLYFFLRLANQAVGDAISDLLLIEAIMNVMDHTIYDWENIYQELPNSTSKIGVANRLAVKVVFDHTKMTAPKGVQEQLESIVNKIDSSGFGRSFVRPSGTEDIVRIYVEASTQEAVDKIRFEVEQLIMNNKEINSK